MTVYHGHRAIDNQENADTTGWRVDWRGANGARGNTGRAVLRCPWDETEQQDRNGQSRTVTRMLAGYNVNDPNSGIWPTDDEHDGIGGFRRFTEHLYSEGYLGAAGFAPIIRPVDCLNVNDYGEFVAGQQTLHPNDPQASCKHRPKVVCQVAIMLITVV
jgi:hypothetical protein